MYVATKFEAKNTSCNMQQKVDTATLKRYLSNYIFEFRYLDYISFSNSAERASVYKSVYRCSDIDYIYLTVITSRRCFYYIFVHIWIASVPIRIAAERDLNKYWEYFYCYWVCILALLTFNIFLFVISGVYCKIKGWEWMKINE